MPADARFQRRVEDFACVHCGTAVRGDGYTNHCPACLWSRHVDVNPGDRAAACGGLMEPVAAISHGRGYRITHHCTACGFERTTRSAPQDSFDAILEVVRARADRLGP